METIITFLMTYRPCEFDANNATSFWGNDVGALHSFLESVLEADNFVTTVLEQGFKVIFTKDPPDFYQEDHNQFAKQNLQFIEQEIRRLWDRGSIV